MIVIKKRLGLSLEKLLNVRGAEVYYAERAELEGRDLDLLLFTQCAVRPERAGKEMLTSLVDLTASQEEIFQGYTPQTRYEIRRCLKGDRVAFRACADPGVADVADFIRFYQRFHQEKALPETERNCRFYQRTLEEFREHGGLVITSAATEEHQTLCMHTYLVDGVRARLINSASVFRDAEPSFKALVGRANRSLHWQDMLYFKGRGYRRYDLGGLSAEAGDTVSKFKKAFGGREVTEFYGLYRPLTWKGRLALWLEGLVQRPLRRRS